MYAIPFAFWYVAVTWLAKIERHPAGCDNFVFYKISGELLIPMEDSCRNDKDTGFELSSVH